MLFNSWEFILFFIFTSVSYYSIDYKYRTGFLLGCSYIFYIYWSFKYAIIMFFITIINYTSGLLIVNSKDVRYKKIALFFGIFFSLCPLLYFKYSNFFITNLNLFLINSNYSQINLNNLILPVGISFFTFQALSYTIDVYFQKIKVEKNLINLSAFISFFPQLVAGPIEKSSNLLHQFNKKNDFNLFLSLEGSKLFIWGLFKKVVVADRLAIYVDRIYDNPDLYYGPTLIVATIFFAFQIYCDFSGYSDMAIGLAKILGFKLMQNFNFPYFATSISQFWKRWHISLSSWFSNYVYKPLGGNRLTIIKWIRNISITFIISGFWHGANWTFIIWGFIHSLYYFLERLFIITFNTKFLNRIRGNPIYNFLCTGVIFLSVCYAWIFFRANTVTDALLITRKIFLDSYDSFYMGSSTVTFLLSSFFILVLIFVDYLQFTNIFKSSYINKELKVSMQIIWYALLLISIASLGISSNSFIYFQF